MVFDDSHPHYAFNKHPSKNRLVLIFDIARPEGFPYGHALGGTTEQVRTLKPHETPGCICSMLHYGFLSLQLEGFIKYFT